MRKNKILTYAAVFIIIVSTFTLIQGYSRFLLENKFFLVGILAVLITLYYPKVYLKTSISWLIFYTIVLLFNYLYGNEVIDFKFILLEITFYFVPAALFLICLKNNDLKSLKIISIAILLVIVITSVLTILQAQVHPNIVRSILAKQGDYTYTMQQFRKGVTNYAMPHALPFIVPPLIYALKDKKFSLKERSLALTIIIISSLMVFYTESTGALVILLFSIIMSFIVTEKSMKKNIVRLIGLGLLASVLLNTQILISILDFFGAKTETMTYYGKIEDTMTMLETGKSIGPIATRQELHNMSINAFLNNPLFGTNKGSDIGGHAYFMDRAGLLGLIGFIPLFLFFFFQIKITYEYLPNSTKMYYLIGIAGCIILGFQKNMGGFEYWLYLFFLLPALCILESSIDECKK